MRSTSRFPRLSPGVTGSAQMTVSDGDTCASAGIGDLQSLSTPRVLALLESAVFDAVRTLLDGELTTVGVRVELEHLLPAGLGERVTATVSLLSVRGRRLSFAGKVLDSQSRAVAIGKLTRAVVEREGFGISA